LIECSHHPSLGNSCQTFKNAPLPKSDKTKNSSLGVYLIDITHCLFEKGLGRMAVMSRFWCPEILELSKRSMDVINHEDSISDA